MTEVLRCVDLFAGAGGFSVGFEQFESEEAEFDVVAAVDNSESAMKTYSHNFEDTEVFTMDVEDFDAALLAQRTEYSAQDIDVVIGGPPCKGFSTAGRMDPDDPRNQLVVEYGETVCDLQPEAVIMENVTGFHHMNDGKYFHELRELLESEGYHVQDPEALVAADYGVPQLRERVIVAATRDGDVIEMPAPTHQVKGRESDKELKQSVSVEDAIDDLSFLKYGEEATEYRLGARTEYQREMRKGSDQIYNHKAPNHGKRVRSRFELFDYGDQMSDLPEDRQTKKHSMLRWHPAEPSPTVTTLPEDFVHYDRSRIPTVREIARIQSFPDWFEFKGPRTTGGSRRKDSVPQYSQVGNAVPPKFASAIATEVMQYLT